MRTILLAAAALAAALLIGCSSAPSGSERADAPSPSAARPAAPPDTTDLAVINPATGEETPPDTALMASAEPWTPRYVPTGLASGIMVEFTGMKKGKTLKARYANIELRRCTGDSADQRKVRPAVSGLMRTQGTINDLHQVFFKVQPGRYFFRLANPWADRRMIRDLEVREGEYAVLTNDVYAAWLRRTHQETDSALARP